MSLRAKLVGYLLLRVTKDPPGGPLEGHVLGHFDTLDLAIAEGRRLGGTRLVAVKVSAPTEIEWTPLRRS